MINDPSKEFMFEYMFDNTPHIYFVIAGSRELAEQMVEARKISKYKGMVIDRKEGAPALAEIPPAKGFLRLDHESSFAAELEQLISRYAGRITFAQAVGLLHNQAHTLANSNL
jgi:hypothetical protein